ncbi:hypothetical protein L596_002220 [Steinernema carpocapsae]|uniref:Uncharacterized protein n=1 Tax=Steinernema carpocapsae TaxID=34508 RepID=A0A4U8UNV8_STECR|nr:hypothetical protein L596_002220 [Steinernema carpocapsae]
MNRVTDWIFVLTERLLHPKVLLWSCKAGGTLLILSSRESNLEIILWSCQEKKSLQCPKPFTQILNKKTC